MSNICLWNFKSVALILFELRSGQNSRMKMNKGKQLQKYQALSYGSCALHFSSIRSVYLWSVMLMPCIVFSYAPDKKRDGRTSRLLYATLWGHKMHQFMIVDLLRPLALVTQTFWEQDTMTCNHNLRQTPCKSIFFMCRPSMCILCFTLSCLLIISLCFLMFR